MLQFMAHETCYFSTDYDKELKLLGDPSSLSDFSTIIQFPYTEPVRPLWPSLREKLTIQDVIEKTDAEVAAQTEKRKEHGRRLQEMQAKQRAEKVCIPSPRSVPG